MLTGLPGRRGVNVLACSPNKQMLQRQTRRNLPVGKHWVLNVQSFTPRLKPFDVVSNITPESVGVVPCHGESSAVRRVRRMVSAALLAEIVLGMCRRAVRCCFQFVPGNPVARKLGAGIQAQNVFHLEVHFSGNFSDTRASFLPAFFLQLRDPFRLLPRRVTSPEATRGQGVKPPREGVSCEETFYKQVLKTKCQVRDRDIYLFTTF